MKEFFIYIYISMDILHLFKDLKLHMSTNITKGFELKSKLVIPIFSSCNTTEENLVVETNLKQLYKQQ